MELRRSAGLVLFAVVSGAAAAALMSAAVYLLLSFLLSLPQGICLSRIRRRFGIAS